MKYLTAIDLNKNALKAAAIDPISTAPASPVVGQAYFNTGTGRLQIWNGTAFGLLADNSAALNGQNAAYYLNRANQTGTQLAASISDLTTAITAIRLDQFVAPTSAVALNGQRISGLANPSLAQDAATMSWVQSQVASAAAGIDSKPSVRVLAAAALVLSGTQTIDGVAVVAGDRVLARAQASASTNGVYVVAAGAWARATDADQQGELTPGAFWYVEEGTTYGKTQWRIENTGVITLGTTDISINQFGAAGGYTSGNGVDIIGTSISIKPVANGGLLADANGVKVDPAVVARKYPFTVGDGASTSIAITHNLNTKDVVVSLRLAATDEMVLTDWIATSVNVVTLTFGTAPAASAIKGVVIG